MNVLELVTKRLMGLAESDRSDTLLSRRMMLMGAAALAGVGRSRTAEAAPLPSSLRWLINRITFGWTPAEQLLADTLGYQGYLEYHLNYTAIDDSALQAQLAPLYCLNLPPYQLRAFNASIVINQLIQATVLRAVNSRRQLFERMVEFWTDHFNIDITKADNSWIKLVDDRDVIRANALGTFPAILHASAQSPAMLQYLDNAYSFAPNANENYARELMELHTLGVGGGYTQTDVSEVARCFTGWSVDDSDLDSVWTFVFRPGLHDNGTKLVLGNTIPANGGMNDALMVLDILSNHPSTATFIATKLCKRFYDYNPPQSLINSVAATYTTTGGDIRQMLRTIFSTGDPSLSNPKIKRPFHYYASGMRAMGAQINGDPNELGSAIRGQLAGAGHQPFFWPTPDGYPDKLEYWDGLLLARWNFAEGLMDGSVDEISVDSDSFFSGATSTQQVIDRINANIFGGQWPASEQAAVQTYLGFNPPTSQAKREAAAIALGGPTYQWY